MDSRKENLLAAIVEEYVKSAIPVSSDCIAESKKFTLSPATIRNEMIQLENEGYIHQPHTSAGRIPTEKGYQYFVDNFLEYREPAKKEKITLRKVFQPKNKPDAIKYYAKILSEISGQA